jgi:hypothetical protein
MKPIFALLLLTFIIGSCRKELVPTKDPYLQNVAAGLKGSMLQSIFSELNFKGAVLSRVDSIDLYILRVPLSGKNLAREFVLLQTTREGGIIKGRMIQLNKETSGVPYEYNGAITIRTLNGTILTTSSVKNGYITAFKAQPKAQRTTSLLPPQYQELPEVVVVASYSSSGMSYSDWACLQTLLDGGSSSGYYYSLDGASPGGGGTSSGGTSGGSSDGGSVTSEGGIQLDSPISIDYENQDVLAPIDIQKYINCFNNIPDVGANCSIEIFVDIPVDSDPAKLFNFESSSPGHTFIQIKKSNGSQSVLQNIGFYPYNGLKTAITNAPMKGKFVDNSEHEFNASLKMDLSPENFRSTITEILYLANFIQYY